MRQPNSALSQSELDRVYNIARRDLLGGDVPAASKPQAVVVAGQPGAGRIYATAQVRLHLQENAGSCAVLSGDSLRGYLPQWRSSSDVDASTAVVTRDIVASWFSRLLADGLTQRANLVVESSLRHPQAVMDISQRFRSSGYEVSAVVVATDRDQSRQATLAMYDLARANGVTPLFVPAALHDDAYQGLRASLSRMEDETAVDRVQVIVADGRQLYVNETDGKRWIRPPNAVRILDDFRERQRTPRELADSALRWQTVVQRLTTDAAVPREVASQAVMWRNEATQVAERDPDARRMLAWGREAETFRTMDRKQFLSEFPQYAKPVERMDEALRYAERNFEKAEDRERFLAQTRERLAQRIAEGRYAQPEQTKDRGRAR
jgi:hypothetical protein